MTVTRQATIGLVVAALALVAGLLVDGNLPRFALDLLWAFELARPAPRGESPAGARPLAESQVVIVDVLDAEQRAIPRDQLARVIRRAAELGAISIGVDMTFAPKAGAEAAGEALRQAIVDTKRVVLAASYDLTPQGPQEVQPCCGLAAAARAQGLVHVHKDLDDGLYRMQHYYPPQYGIRTRWSMPLELAAWHLGYPEGRSKIEETPSALVITTPGGTVVPIPCDERGYSLVPYMGPAHTIPGLRHAALFAADAPRLDGKTVLLGSFQTDIDDAYPTPFHRKLGSRMAGTEILAQTLTSMIAVANHDPYPSLAYRSTQHGMCAAAAVLGTAAALLLPPPIALGVLGLLFALIWFNTYELFMFTQVLVNPLGASTALATSGVAMLIVRMLALHSERLRLEGLMETYFEEELVPGQASASQTGGELVTRLLAAKDLLAPPGMVIDGQLGMGGMSVVLAAHQKAGGREVALKLLSPALFRDEESRHRFRREADTASSIKHPNVVGVIASGNRLGYLFMPYIAYERVRGPTLRSLLAQERRFAPGRAVAVANQVLAGLAAAHEKNIIHRDVKPENVIITPEGVVKVLDFGIARIAEADDGFRTRTGIVLGTPAYMAPEVVRGNQATPAADLYATGIMLYELIVGEAPFAMENVSATLVAHLEKKPRTPSERGVDIPRALEATLMSLLEKNPEQRPASALAAIDLLAPFAGSIVGKDLPIAEEVVAASTAQTRAVKPSLAASGTVQVQTGSRDKLGTGRVLTPRRGPTPTLGEEKRGEEKPDPHAAPTASYGEMPGAQPTVKEPVLTPSRKKGA